MRDRGLENYAVAAEVVTRLSAAIERLAPEPSKYRVMANRALQQPAIDRDRAWALAAALRAFRADVERGCIRALEEQVREQVYEDLLDLAAHIAASLHVAPAAVLAGSVLEEHVRKLAAKHGIALVDARAGPRAFEQLCHELVSAGAFREPQRKVLAAWYGQRTEAAHGRFENVIRDDVPRMIDGVRDFLVRHAA